MKSILKLRITELGALSLSTILVYFLATFFFDHSAFAQTNIGQVVGAMLAISAVCGVLLVIYCAGHATFTHRWSWFFGCTFFWPLTLLYWWRYIRPELAHDAQQAVPADGPRAARASRR